MLPPVPPWEGIHPLLVHFPVALLVLAPLPALAALLVPGRRVLLTAVAFAVVALGALGAVLAAASGEAADESVQARGLETPAVHETLEEHEELAETTRTAAIVLMLAFGGSLIAFRKGKTTGGAAAGIGLALLAGTLAVAVLVANTAHSGGQLVHRHGVLAPLAPGEQPGGGPGVAERSSGEREDDD